MDALVLDGVCKRFDGGNRMVTVVNHVNLRLATGSFTTIMAPLDPAKLPLRTVRLS